MEFNPNRLKLGDLVAGGAGFVLFISLFLDWYTLGIRGVNAWDAFDLWSFILFLIALTAIGVAVVRALGVQLPQLPVPLSTILMGLGALATLYVLFRLVNPPGFGDGLGRGIGLWLGLLSSIAIAAGGFLSARERGEAVPGVAGGLGGAGGAGGGGPLGGGTAGGGGYQAQPGAGQPAGGGGGGYAGQPGGVGAASAGAADPGAAAAAPAASGPRADWYPDPQGTARLRYWDGTQWTDQTAD
jgi:hypothetical protein